MAGEETQSVMIGDTFSLRHEADACYLEKITLAWIWKRRKDKADMTPIPPACIVFLLPAVSNS
jgi:hypothetical protein